MRLSRTVAATLSPTWSSKQPIEIGAAEIKFAAQSSGRKVFGKVGGDEVVDALRQATFAKGDEVVAQQIADAGFHDLRRRMDAVGADERMLPTAWRAVASSTPSTRSRSTKPATKSAWSA